MRTTLRTMGAALLLAAMAAGARAEGLDKGLRAVLAEDACAGAALGLKAGERVEWKRYEAEDLEGRWFLVLKAGGRRVLLDLRRGRDGWEVVEHRAWMLRNGQRRALTDNEGLPACLPRLGVPIERMERILTKAEGAGRWTRDAWPAAPKPKKTQGKAKPKAGPAPR